jgi:hypothetical protein
MALGFKYLVSGRWSAAKMAPFCNLPELLIEFARKGDNSLKSFPSASCLENALLGLRKHQNGFNWQNSRASFLPGAAIWPPVGIAYQDSKEET